MPNEYNNNSYQYNISDTPVNRNSDLACSRLIDLYSVISVKLN